ncbi:MAG: hypothetical protein R2716_10665 [Microthrixaceae bacterium]
MGCGCLILLASGISPRLALFLMWLFTDRLSLALDSFWLGLAGFLVLPWTTLAWAVAYAPFTGVEGFGVLLVAFGFVVDVSSWLGTGRERSRRVAA